MWRANPDPIIVGHVAPNAFVHAAVSQIAEEGINVLQLNDLLVDADDGNPGVAADRFMVFPFGMRMIVATRITHKAVFQRSSDTPSVSQFRSRSTPQNPILPRASFPNLRNSPAKRPSSATDI
jgi:hypothetical protein